MAEQIGVPLDKYETEQVLESQGLGVLGFAKENEAYTIPIAYAYDASTDRCLFRFVITADSTKAAFLSAVEIASLTVYEWRGVDDWRSVVARGPLQPLPPDDIGHAAALFSDLGNEAALDIFNEPLTEYETAWYELEIDELTARGKFPDDTGTE